jgi:2-methylisocitrate lyase-like PEP mutase family enzyme
MGKEIVDREIYYTRLRAAVYARDQLQSDMMIIARTDARQKYGFDEAIERLKEAVNIGVDIVFLEALQSKEEAKKVCQIMGDVPVLLNMVPGGTTPDMTVEEAKETGFRIMIFPGVCLAAVATSVGNALDELQGERRVSQPNGQTGVKSLFNLCGLQDCIELDKRAGGKAYADVGK